MFDYEKYIRKNNFPLIWCPGCGHGIVLGSLYLHRALGIRVWLAAALNVGAVALAVPISSVVVRAPV